MIRKTPLPTSAAPDTPPAADAADKPGGERAGGFDSPAPEVPEGATESASDAEDAGAESAIEPQSERRDEVGSGVDGAPAETDVVSGDGADRDGHPPQGSAVASGADGSAGVPGERVRAITIAVLAMGGEGGGVLTDWIAEIARHHDWVAQTTSVAGVAQRTGATVYYVELFPPSSGSSHVRVDPVLSTMPTPGEVDIVIASELMEAGRAVQRGFVTPDRTTLIASTNRVYSITEKSGLGDARVDSTALIAGAENASKRLVSADFMELAVQARSVISASLFGALAGSEALPFDRSVFEDAIRASGKGVEQSLAAFAAGHDVARRVVDAERTKGKTFVSIGTRPKSDEELRRDADAEPRRLAASSPRALVGPALADQADRVARDIPEGARLMALRGVQRVAVYQNVAYADRYLDRVARFARFETEEATARLSTELARYTALWMTYQDTIHVAFQKVRRGRLAGVRAEARAKDEHPVQVREYLHPQVEEITDTLPVGIGAALRRSKGFHKVVDLVAKKGIVVNTTSVFGYATLSTLARLRPIRPRSLRFAHEQAEIDAWLDEVARIAGHDYDLAVEMACLPRVLKGYGETWERGERHFADLMAEAERLDGTPDAARALAARAKAVLA